MQKEHIMVYFMTDLKSAGEVQVNLTKIFCGRSYSPFQVYTEYIHLQWMNC